MKRLSLYCGLFILLLFIGCKHDFTGTGEMYLDLPVDDAATVSAGITGIVVDENNVPIANVQVQSGSNITTTNFYGIFQFRNISMSKSNATVKVIHSGYFTAFRTFVATPGINHQVRIKLMPKTNAGNFNGSSGGTITISGGGKMVMPANAVTDAAGNAYTGTVNVAMTWINPTSNDLSSTIPGDLRGINTNGRERALETYGMLGVELTGNSGQALKIATGKKAQLSFPLPTSVQGSAPATIPLWHFDEAKARWVEEGSATKTGNLYVGEVSHFSFWNCDAPFEQVNLCMKVLTTSGQPIPGVRVRIRRTASGPGVPSAQGITDSSGTVCGIVPRNEALILEIISSCGTVVHTQNIGPFSSNTSLPPIAISINSPGWLVVTGQAVNCTNNPVTNGSVLITYNGGNFAAAQIVNGNFTVPISNCSSNPLNISVTAIDNTIQQQSNTITSAGVNGSLNIGVLTACGNTIQEFLDLTIDGVPYSWTSADSLSGNSQPLQAQWHSFRITGTRTTGGLTNFIFMNLGHLSSAPTSGNLTNFYFYSGGDTSRSTLMTLPTINITEVGPYNAGFVSGNFNVQVTFNLPPAIRTVNGQFRIRRMP
jgi:hypothetical protein